MSENLGASDYHPAVQQLLMQLGTVTPLDSDPNRPWGGWYLLEQGEDFFGSRHNTLGLRDYLLDKHGFPAEIRSSYDQKILHVKPGTLLSLQFHGTPQHAGHAELWHAQTPLRVILSKTNVVDTSIKDLRSSAYYEENLMILNLHQNDQLLIPPGYIHAIANPFGDDALLTEIRISQGTEFPVSREQNITRIFDQTRRDGCDPYPEWLIDRVMLAENTVVDERSDSLIEKIHSAAATFFVPAIQNATSQI